MMSVSRRWFLTMPILFLAVAGCSGVQKRPASRVNRQAKVSAPPNRTAVLGGTSEEGIEVVAPEVSSRVDPEPGME